MQITTVGLDLAKRVFQVHAIDASGGVVVRKALPRSQVLPFFTKLSPCLIGIEACGTSHHWARELTKLGHEVRFLLARKPVRVASVAMANKMARVVWAIMVRGEVYQARHVPHVAA